MLKSKNKKLILGILLCICAAFFACGIFAISNTKDRGQTVTAEASAVTSPIYWRLSSDKKTFELSANSLSGGTARGSVTGNQSWYSQISSYVSTITKVNVLTPIAPAYMNGWFSGFTGLTDISTLNKIDTSNCVSLSSTFYNCKSITSFEPIRNWDVSNVTEMQNAFNNCSAIESIEFLADWNVSNVVYLFSLFQGCSSLKSIDPIYGWKISDNLDNLSGLFQGCSMLTSVDLTRLNWNWSNIQDVSYLFYDCALLQSVNVSNIVTTNTKLLTTVFYSCPALTTIEGLDTWDVSGAIQLYATFGILPSITSLDLSNFKNSGANVDAMVHICLNLESLDISGIEVSSTQVISTLLYNCPKLKQLSISNSVAKKISSTQLFTFCPKWYDQSGNEYTKSNPMTTGGTYYTEKPVCQHENWQLTSTDPAGCTTTGTEHYTCPDCGETKTETIPAIGSHDWNDWVTTTPATCTAKGVKKRTCKRDATHTETGEVDMIAHDYNTEYTTDVEATCTTTGTKSKHCKNCTAKTDEQTISSTGHAWGEWSTTTAASCTTAGSEKRVCGNNAEHTETRAINATGHSYTDVVTQPTCENGGYTTHTCSKCNDSYTDTDKPATGHTWGEPKWQWATNYLTCSAKFTCSTCNKEQIETASVEHNSATASCTVAGDTTHIASVSFNNKSYSDSKVVSGQTLPHTWQLKTESVPPDCENDGAGEFECKVCHKVETRAIEALGHDFADEFTTDTEATCTEEGSKSKHCSRCDEKSEVTAIEKTGHTPGEEATCTTAQICEVCGTELAPATGHNWTTDWDTDTTNHWHECTVCHEKKDEAEHTYDWVITKDPTEEEEGEKEEYCTVCEYANGNKETIAKLVSDDNGNVSDLPVLPPNQDYDLEIAVKESDSLYNIAGITKGYKVELFVVDGENRTEYDNSKKVTLMLVIPEGMEDEFTLYCRHGDILEPVDPATYTVSGKSVTIRTTLPNEYVFNAPAPEEPAQPSAGIPWWVWLLVGLVSATLLTIIIVFIVVAKKKKNDNTPSDNGEVLSQLAEQGEKIDELLTRSDDGGFNTPVELDENGNVIFK